MLILKNNNDYYDGVAGSTGVDKTIVYDRKLLEFDGNSNEVPAFFRSNGIRFITPFENLRYYKLANKNNHNYEKYSYFIVGFCGKLYVGWKFYSKGKEIFNSNTYAAITTIIYDFNMVKTLLKFDYWRNGNKNVDDEYYTILRYDASEIFRQYNSPVFIYDCDYKRTEISKYSYAQTSKFIINPILKDYDFGKVFDAFQAFQEIQMYISGVLGSPDKNIVEVSDKNKIEQYGFDYKWSFRKESKNG